ncbi:MAG: transporter substrate-binding domain-containing protein [Proteobacteria bacterium]|nr:transporter substrate-binding domain-containing protein [Pseudomonadota bacterium]
MILRKIKQNCKVGLILLIGIACLPVGLSAQTKELRFHTGVSKSGEISIMDKVAWLRLTEAFERSGLDVKPVLVQIPSERALITTNIYGDGELMRVKNIKELAPEKTANIVIIPEVIMVLKIMVFTKHLNFTVKGWESLQPYQNGVQRGIKLIEKKAPNRNYVNHISQAFKMLNLDRIDTVLFFRLVGLQTINTLNIRGIKMLEPPLQRIEVYPFLHKKHENLIPKIVTAIKTMKKDGRFQQIREQVLNDILL